VLFRSGVAVRKILLAVGLLLVAVPSAHATSITYNVVLTGAQEIPQVVSPGTGVATIITDNVAHTLFVDVTFAGLLFPTIASHIHCCVPLGTNAIVATQTPTFIDFPLGVMSGTYLHTFDTLMLSTYNNAFVVAHGGTPASAEADLFAGLAAGQAYINIHTTQFPGGEIRGNIAALPEPASLTLVGIGLVAAARRRLRRRA